MSKSGSSCSASLPPSCFFCGVGPSDLFQPAILTSVAVATRQPTHSFTLSIVRLQVATNGDVKGYSQTGNCRIRGYPQVSGVGEGGLGHKGGRCWPPPTLRHSRDHRPEPSWSLLLSPALFCLLWAISRGLAVLLRGKVSYSAGIYPFLYHEHSSTVQHLPVRKGQLDLWICSRCIKFVQSWGVSFFHNSWF